MAHCEDCKRKDDKIKFLRELLNLLRQAKAKAEASADEWRKIAMETTATFRTEFFNGKKG